MKRKVSVSALLALILLAVLTTYLITNTVVEQRFSAELAAISESRADFRKLSAVDRIVRENYVAKVDETLSSEGSVAGYLAALNDPRSRYLDRDSYETYKAQNEGKTAVCGITLGYDEEGDRIVVVRVTEGSSAAQAGIAAGDLVLSVNGLSVTEAEFEEFSAAMQGKTGERFTLEYQRDGETKSAELTYTASGDGDVSGRMCFTQAAYLVFDGFSKDCSIKLSDEVNALIEQGADVLIFDLRGVESTAFAEAAKCVGVIAGNVELARKVSAGGTVETVTGDTTPIPLPCAVLIDKDTSGAGELFAAALRDTRGAKIFGTQSAGNASVQSIIELSDKSAIELTTEIYLPPVSDSFDFTGVVPDLMVISSSSRRAASDESDPVLKAAYGYLKPRYAGLASAANS